MRLPRAAASIALASATIAGCGSSLVCTMAVCASRVGFYVSPVTKLWPKAVRVRACVDHDCRSVSPFHRRLLEVSGPGDFLCSAREGLVEGADQNGPCDLQGGSTGGGPQDCPNRDQV